MNEIVKEFTEEQAAVKFSDAIYRITTGETTETKDEELKPFLCFWKENKTNCFMIFR